MSLPARTAEQRAEALTAALASRRARAELRTSLKEGRRSGVDIVVDAESDDTWHGVRVRWLLESLPGIGPIRAEQILQACAIAPTRRLGGLTVRQRASLVGALGGGA